ncbi:uncharacterized protein AMSG_11658 [Thecamonas trahens ATCC 50062]|uniref:Type I inositol-3,4-bisphosphate 4-phosphatase n=1 Tax=Thecamonas trahens ATCC 50062 TaxID=461836 RepID=A0A0L0DTB9_THETB|nr:hypothetical protein AMSG_11658 [Thecamonas trahens ATCC 50062]KNC54698.1 hypothetical protein AMSG_11658 [Thecamonas trahens ATCC 50062]|eukprot:XP_013761768.1 hypothetical protein AMSG_11658 [Thecamonas trahens ATCC 50062]
MYSKPWNSTGPSTRYVEAARTEVISRAGHVNSGSFATLLSLHRPRAEEPFDLSPLKFAVYMSSGDNLKLPSEEDLVGAIRVSGTMQPGQHATTALKTRRGVEVGQLNIRAEGVAPPFDSPSLVDHRYKWGGLYVHETLEASSFAFTTAQAALILAGQRHVLDLRVALKAAEATLREVQAEAAEFDEACAAGRAKAKDRPRSLSARVRDALLDGVRIFEHLYSIRIGLAAAEAGAVDSKPFKPSTAKSDVSLRFVATNLHVQRMSVGTTLGRPLRTYCTVTVGAPADHASGFKDGGGIRQLEAKLMDAIRASASGPADVDLQELQWRLLARRDAAQAQALAALVTAFVANFNNAVRELLYPGSPEARLAAEASLDLLARFGFVFELESLLSTAGSELGMLGDAEAAMRSLRSVRIFLYRWEDAHKAGETVPVPSDAAEVDLLGSDTEWIGIVPCLVDVRHSDLSRSAAEVRLWLSMPPGVEEQPEYPDALRRVLNAATSGGIEVFPIVFTQGINEKQSMANFGTAHPMLSSLFGSSVAQSEINNENLAQLASVYAKVRSALEARVADGDLLVAPLDELDARLAQISETVALAAVGGKKNVSVLTQTSRFVRRLGGGRATCCKSAKDRTSMAVTLEQASLLADNHGLETEIHAMCTVMRALGVRRENAFVNAGRRKYAFNAFQAMLLPSAYKPPAGAGGSVVS